MTFDCFEVEKAAGIAEKLKILPKVEEDCESLEFLKTQQLQLQGA